MRKRILVWDLPTRLFHWTLAAAVAGLVATGQIGGNLIFWHARIGIAVAGLVVFRLIWGLLGSSNARFINFLPTPAKVTAYLKGQWQGHGHNPLGALSVIALLGVVALQVGTGLFSNDDIAFNAPFYPLIDKEVSDRLTGLHHFAANLLYLLVGLHIAAIVFYTHVKKDNLVKPMLTGWKEVAEGESARRARPLALAFALALASLGVWAASGAWVPEPPPPPPAAETPAW